MSARAIAEAVADPELPMVTLADLGVLREVSEVDNQVTVTITPTYSGCPAMDAMRADLVRALRHAGYSHVQVRTALHPPWSSEWITAEGRRKLAEAGIAPPGAARRRTGPIPLALDPSRSPVRCPNCGSADTGLLSRFGSTACKSLHRCHACDEPFEHIKEI